MDLIFLFCKLSMDEEMVKILMTRPAPRKTSCPSQPWLLVLTGKKCTKPRLSLGEKTDFSHKKKRERFLLTRKKEENQEKERNKGLKEYERRTRITFFHLLSSTPL